MKSEAGVNLGFGFVCYKSPDSAFKAKTEGANLLFKGGKLFISSFEPKEVRTAHLQEKVDRVQF